MESIQKKASRARRLTGVVVSAKMEKTAVVLIEHTRMHARYEKLYRVTRRLKAHNEENRFKAGDRVILEETRPLSKEKHWRIIAKVDEHLTTSETSVDRAADPTMTNPTLNPKP